MTTTETPRPIVTVNDWGRRGWRVCLYQPAPPRDWNAMGRSLRERFVRTESAARKLAAEWARAAGIAAALLLSAAPVALAANGLAPGELAAQTIPEVQEQQYFKPYCRDGKPVFAAYIVAWHGDRTLWAIIPAETPDGRALDPAAAERQFWDTGLHFGIFDSYRAADEHFAYLNEPDASESVAMCAEQQRGDTIEPGPANPAADMIEGAGWNAAKDSKSRHDSGDGDRKRRGD